MIFPVPGHTSTSQDRPPFVRSSGLMFGWFFSFFFEESENLPETKNFLSHESGPEMGAKINFKYTPTKLSSSLHSGVGRVVCHQILEVLVSRAYGHGTKLVGLVSGILRVDY